MSHIATNWAFQLRGLRPSAKIVLLVLADCHNPANGCFPTQAFLAEACEMSRDSVNVQLAQLEDMGLIRRIRSIDPVSKRQRPTRYKLAFEADFKAEEQPETAPDAVSEIPTREAQAVSESAGEPCRNQPVSRVGNSDTNPVREPLREPVVRGAADEHTLAAFEEWWKLYPRPRDRDRSARLFCEAVASGVDPAWIIASAKRYRAENAGNSPMYQAYGDNWLALQRWEDHDPPALPAEPPSTDDALEGAAQLWGKIIREGGYVPPSAVTARLVSVIVQKGYATEAQMRAKGIRP